MSDPFGLNKTLDPAVMGNPKTQGATLIAESVLPLEPVPQNHFGPTDWANRCFQGPQLPWGT